MSMTLRQFFDRFNGMFTDAEVVIRDGVGDLWEVSDAPWEEKERQPGGVAHIIISMSTKEFKEFEDGE